MASSHYLRIAPDVGGLTLNAPAVHPYDAAQASEGDEEDDGNALQVPGSIT